MNSLKNKGSIYEPVFGNPCSSYQKSKNCYDSCKQSVDGEICYCMKQGTTDQECQFSKIESPCTSYQKSKNCYDDCKRSYDNITICACLNENDNNNCKFPKEEPTSIPDNKSKICINKNTFNNLLNLALKNCM